jgi:hypothetical protein
MRLPFSLGPLSSLVKPPVCRWRLLHSNGRRSATHRQAWVVLVLAAPAERPLIACPSMRGHA